MRRDRLLTATSFVLVDYDIAREAARVRAMTGMRTPDALIVATCLVSETDVLVTNDRILRAGAVRVAPELSVCVLADLLEQAPGMPISQ